VPVLRVKPRIARSVQPILSKTSTTPTRGAVAASYQHTLTDCEDRVN
jgi:hypothetical protein